MKRHKKLHAKIKYVLTHKNSFKTEKKRWKHKNVLWDNFLRRVNVHSQSFQSLFLVFQIFFFLGQGLFVSRGGSDNPVAGLFGQRLRWRCRTCTFIRRCGRTGLIAVFWFGVNLGVNLGARAVVIISLQQKLSSLLVECRFGIRHDQETLDGEEDVFQTLKSWKVKPHLIILWFTFSFRAGASNMRPASLFNTRNCKFFINNLSHKDNWVLKCFQI